MINIFDITAVDRSLRTRNQVSHVMNEPCFNVSVKCSAGYYAGDSSCKKCSVGTYSDTAGQTECTACDSGLSTLGEAASKSSECISEYSCELETMFRLIATGVKGRGSFY